MRLRPPFILDTARTPNTVTASLGRRTYSTCWPQAIDHRSLGPRPTSRRQPPQRGGVPRAAAPSHYAPRSGLSLRRRIRQNAGDGALPAPAFRRATKKSVVTAGRAGGARAMAAPGDRGSPRHAWTAKINARERRCPTRRRPSGSRIGEIAVLESKLGTWSARTTAGRRTVPRSFTLERARTP